MIRRPSALTTALTTALSLIAVVQVAGCVDLAPAYHRPGLPVPASFSATSPITASPDLGSWRTFFRDPRLAKMIDLALANNRDLRVAVANVAAARGDYVVQRSSLFPKLSAVGAASYGQTPASVAGGGPAATGQVNEKLFSAAGRISAWQLDLFGRLRNGARAALETYFATREAADAARITLVSETATGWLTLGADRALLAIARNTAASGEASVSLVRARQAAGVASDIDLAQAQTVVEQARADAARLTALVEIDRHALERVVGSPVPDDLLPSDIDDPGLVMPALPDALPATALLARPDVAQSEDQLKAANADIGAARAAFFPNISLTGSGGVTSLALSALFKSASQTWTFAPSVTESVVDFGANRGALSRANAQRDAAKANYDRTVQTAFREVADALSERATIDAQLSSQIALSSAADRAYTLTDARYRQGSDSYLALLVTQRSAYAARQSLTSVKLARATNLVTLYTTLGGGLR